MPIKKRMLYLGAGLQSSGTTLISWCFLQRRDMDGVLDTNSEMLAKLPVLTTPFTWLKTTIVSFRTSEQLTHFQDMGWTVRPILICRDVREAYASLRTKEYGRNGTTAEDPPLRLRFRRFREDWELFRQKNWPILRFDQFLKEPEKVLRAACNQLGLPWDEAMIAWPKPRSAIKDARFGNETFNQTCGQDLLSAINSFHHLKKRREFLEIPCEELIWLEEEFAHYNEVNGYPAHVPIKPVEVKNRDWPCFTVTRKFIRLQRSPIKLLRKRVGKWVNAKGHSINHKS